MKLSEKFFARTLSLLVILLIALLVVEFVVAGECDKNATKTETVVEHSQQRFQRVIKDKYADLIVYVDTETNVIWSGCRRTENGCCCVFQSICENVRFF